eukprot:1100409-Pelagomonas_calceolata.AAC.5
MNKPNSLNGQSSDQLQKAKVGTGGLMVVATTAEPQPTLAIHSQAIAPQLNSASLSSLKGCWGLLLP